MRQLALYLLLLSTVLLMTQCGNESSAPTSAAEMAPEPGIQINPVEVAPPGTVFHYICPNNCDGGGGPGQGACPVCGTELVHNDAFHNQPGAPPDDVQMLNTPPAGLTPPTPAVAEPAQNAKGVWHYICSNGCPGGAGSATACAGCGNMLMHNSAYHQ
jgi:hypothetical protein